MPNWCFLDNHCSFLLFVDNLCKILYYYYLQIHESVSKRFLFLSSCPVGCFIPSPAAARRLWCHWTPCLVKMTPWMMMMLTQTLSPTHTTRIPHSAGAYVFVFANYVNSWHQRFSYSGWSSEQEKLWCQFFLIKF